MFQSTPLQSLEIFGPLEVPFSYFTRWNQFDIWIIFGIFEKSLPGPVLRNSAARLHLNPARCHADLDWPGPLGRNPFIMHVVPELDFSDRSLTGTGSRRAESSSITLGFTPPHVSCDLIPRRCIEEKQIFLSPSPSCLPILLALSSPLLCSAPMKTATSNH
jgi:hypothetical protein